MLFFCILLMFRVLDIRGLNACFHMLWTRLRSKTIEQMKRSNKSLRTTGTSGPESPDPEDGRHGPSRTANLFSPFKNPSTRCTRGIQYQGRARGAVLVARALGDVHICAPAALVAGASRVRTCRAHASCDHPPYATRMHHADIKLCSQCRDGYRCDTVGILDNSTPPAHRQARIRARRRNV
jgi:hypothetical protein